MKQFSILFLLAIISAHLMGQVHWTKYPENPVMRAGTSGDWDKNQVTPTTVIYQDSMYHMWYWGGDFDVHNFQIGYASSPDGVNWTKDTLHNPVLKLGPAGAWDDYALSTPSVLFRDSTYHMWYTGSKWTSSGSIMRIGHATSDNGIEWIKDTAHNPVLDLGPAGSWDNEMLADVTVVHSGIEYHMWYTGGFLNGLAPLGHATSTDGSNWTKDSLNPVLMKDESWEVRGIESSMVVYDDSVFNLWYLGGNLGKWSTGFATSLDGINWTKDIRNPIFKGTPGTWNEKYIGGIAIIDSAHIKYKMWYGGITSGLGYADIGYAESDDFVSIPDTAFLNALIDEGVDTNNDSFISYDEAEAVTILDVSGEWSLRGNITDMTGIEAFVNLEELGCSFNLITFLDVSKNTELRSLGCDQNQLIHLDVSKNTALRPLNCSYNQLTSLDVSNNTALTELLCGDNQLISLDVSNNRHLGDHYKSVAWAYPQIDLSNMPSLCEVCVWETFFSDQVRIDTTGSPNVEFKDCSSTTGIDKSGLTELSIYPNPANSLLTIETEISDHYSIEIATLNGQLLFSGEMEGTTHQLDLSSFESGIYFITIRSLDFVTTRKLIRL